MIFIGSSFFSLQRKSEVLTGEAKETHRNAPHCKAKEPLGKELQWRGEVSKRMAKQRNGIARKRVAMERRSNGTAKSCEAKEKLRVDSI